MRRTIILAAIALASTAAGAQMTPYAGMQNRPIKALSDQQMADLTAGRGMGLALPAELNGYPGPAHVLELSDKLALTPDQKVSVQSLFHSMKAEAVPLGAKLIAEEKELNQQFADHTVTPDSLKKATAAAALTQGELRDTHLKYHLAMVKVLTEAQMRKYAELRGYDDGGHQMMHHHE
jgi:hypothetical protein